MHTCILVCDAKTKRRILRKATAGRPRTTIILGDRERENKKRERVPEWNLSWGQARSLRRSTFAPVSYWLIIASLLFSKELLLLVSVCFLIFYHLLLSCCVNPASHCKNNYPRPVHTSMYSSKLPSGKLEWVYALLGERLCHSSWLKLSVNVYIPWRAWKVTLCAIL